MSASWKGKRVAVIGFGIEGEAAAAYLVAAGAEVTVCDAADAAALGQRYLSWRDRVARWQLGASYLNDLKRFNAIFRSPGTRFYLELVAAREAGVVVTSGTKEFFLHCPAEIIGVTGTKGKGTTSTLIAAMLRATGRRTHLVGNIGRPALAVLPEIRPDDLVVYELSSFQLEDLERSPHVAVVLGVTVDHQDYHPTPAAYEQAKSSIVRFQHADDVAVVTIDYPASERLASLTVGRVIPISTKQKLEYGVFVENGALVRAIGGEVEHLITELSLGLAGAFNLENAAAAAAVASSYQVTADTIGEVLRTFTGLPHRFQHVATVGSVSYWDNSFATTPETTIAALQSFDQPIVLLLGGREKGFTYDALGEAIVTTPVKAIIGIGENSSAMYAAVTAAARRATTPPPVFVDGGGTMEHMVAAAAKVAEAGSCVLLSPAAASFDKFNNASDRGDQFQSAVRALRSS